MRGQTTKNTNLVESITSSFLKSVKNRDLHRLSNKLWRAVYIKRILPHWCTVWCKSDNSSKHYIFFYSFLHTQRVFNKPPPHFPPKNGPRRTFATWAFYLKSAPVQDTRDPHLQGDLQVWQLQIILILSVREGLHSDINFPSSKTRFPAKFEKSSWKILSSLIYKIFLYLWWIL